NACDVAIWSVQASNKAKCNRVASSFKDDWNFARSGFCRERRLCSGRRDDTDLPSNQIGCHCGKLLVMPFGPSIFDRDVLVWRNATASRARPLDEPSFIKPITGTDCSARTDSGQNTAKPALLLMKSRRFTFPSKTLCVAFKHVTQ